MRKKLRGYLHDSLSRKTSADKLGFEVLRRRRQRTALTLIVVMDPVVGGGVFLLGMISIFSLFSKPPCSGDLVSDDPPFSLAPVGGKLQLLCDSPCSLFGRICNLLGVVAMDDSGKLFWRGSWSVGMELWLGLGGWLSDLIEGERLIGGEMFKWVGQIWATDAWSFLRSFRSTRIVGAVVLSPELVPVVCSPFTGVGSSFIVLTVFWTARVGSGWSSVLLFVSTGLLYGFSRWSHVIVIIKRLRSSVDFGSSSMPKGVVEFGVSLMPKGVTCAGPYGIIILLTLVSGLSSRGFNPCRAVRLDVSIVLLYVSIVSVIVSLMLITYHIFIVVLF